MRQNTSLTVAPTDPAPRWPAGYEAVLREAGAQEKTIPYCIGWVRTFFSRHPGRRRRDLGRAEIETFLSELAARAGTENWQVQQARDALELYYERFRGIALQPRSGIPKLHVTSSPAVAQVTPSVTPPTDRTAMLAANLKSNLKSRYSSAVGGVKGISAAAESAKKNTARENVRPPAGNKSVAATREGERLREPRSPGVAPEPPTAVAGAPGPVNWPVLDAKIRECLRVGHYSYRTEQTYLGRKGPVRADDWPRYLS